LYFVPERKVSVVRKIDVFIAGGGCAGTGAAIAAARNGLKVIVAERMFYLGGNMTGGLMGKICIGHGTAEELLVRLDKYQGTNFIAGKNFIPEDPAFLPARTQIPIDPEITKFVLEKMVIDESGAEVLYGTGISSHNELRV
jgi:NADPH-dependent 2,4-dienoyl-CoA reductase/sulfur reductase-like enzyme